MYLHSLISVLPRHKRPQQDIVQWTIEAHKKYLSYTQVSPEEERMIPLLKKFCVSERLISQRYFECGEVDQEWESHEIYKITSDQPRGADIYQRNKFFEHSTRRVFQEFYDGHKTPEHLIHVSCTGYVAPSPAQIYFSHTDLSPAITHAYHMGCYASLPSVRMAAALAVGKTVDVVHTELCSLHLDLARHTPEQMVVQTLFADGHIKYSLSDFLPDEGFKVHLIEERLVRDSLDDMSWVPGPFGMMMTLSREVPSKIQSGIREFIHSLCDRANLDHEKILKDAIFAIHPGGPKIIDAIKTTLSLSDEQTVSCQKILFERGNMSSATLPHVWQDILLMKPSKGTFVVSLAFGPGLTMFGGVFEVV